LREEGEGIKERAKRRTLISQAERSFLLYEFGPLLSERTLSAGPEGARGFGRVPCEGDNEPFMTAERGGKKISNHSRSWNRVIYKGGKKDRRTKDR